MYRIRCCSARNGGRIRAVDGDHRSTDRRRFRDRRGSGAIGIDVDLPTAPADPVDPVFGLSLSGFQLPGAATPRDIRVAADGLDELDDALLDLVLSLVKAQADAAAAGSPIAAVGGLLGLKSGDAVPDFPITQLADAGRPRARRLGARHRHDDCEPRRLDGAIWRRSSAERRRRRP